MVIQLGIMTPMNGVVTLLVTSDRAHLVKSGEKTNSSEDQLTSVAGIIWDSLK